MSFQLQVASCAQCLVRFSILYYFQLLFCSSPGESVSSTQSPVHRNNLYSRHSFSQLQKAQNSGTKLSENDKSMTENDGDLGVYGRSGQMRKNTSPISNTRADAGM